MASAAACEPAPDEPCSSAAGARAAAVSRHRKRPFSSLRGRADFQRLRRECTRRRVGGVTVVAAAGGPRSPLVGVLAGKAVGGAVRRNRAKRRLREAVARASLRGDRDYLVIAGEAVPSAPFGALVGWVTAAVEELS
jgi:ribonuclease P protein component